MGFSYEDLAFLISDSITYRAFARLRGPTSSSGLQSGIASIRPETWEKINKGLLLEAAHMGIEKGRVTRTDATVMESNIHKPADNTLLYDGIRLITRILNSIKEKGYIIPFRDHTRAGKKYSRKIENMCKGPKQIAHYRKLIGYARNAHGYLAYAIATYGDEGHWALQAIEVLDRMDRVIDQTRRRVIHGETVPASEKEFSFFEAHTDIIKKGARDIQYGHKLNLTTGKTGLVIDLFIEDGNPVDSTTAVRMVKRQTEIYGRPPRQTCFDGGYASTQVLAQIKEEGVEDVAFHKKRSLKQEDMTKSNWVYRKLIKFRAGVEGNISTLKLRYGWYRCNWTGLDRFKAYAWLSVVAYNLVTFARLSI